MTVSIANAQRLVLDVTSNGLWKRIYVFTGLFSFDGGGLTTSADPTLFIPDSEDFKTRGENLEATVITAASAFSISGGGGTIGVEGGIVYPDPNGLKLAITIDVKDNAILYKVSYQITAIATGPFN